MVISNINNRTPKSAILFTDIGDSFNIHDFIKQRVEVMFYYTINCEQKLNHTSDCKRSEGAEGVIAECREAPFSILLLDYTDYVLGKGLKNYAHSFFVEDF